MCNGKKIARHAPLSLACQARKAKRVQKWSVVRGVSDLRLHLQNPQSDAPRVNRKSNPLSMVPPFLKILQNLPVQLN